MHAAPLPFHDGVDAEAPAAFTVLLSLLTPRGRGRVRLLDADPATASAIELSLDTDPADRETLRAGYHRLLELSGGLCLARLLDCPYLRDRDNLDRVEFDAWSRRWIQTLYHPVGTCAMGIGAEAVVDLHVHDQEPAVRTVLLVLLSFRQWRWLPPLISKVMPVR